MTTTIAIIWLHFLADFVLQSDYMAQNKSRSNTILSYHAAIYTVPFLIFGYRFAIVNGAAHWLVDWCTSRINSRLWAEKKVHAFFVCIGVDQAIHMTTLLLTYKYIGGR
jgi:hypothetical protein